MGAIWADDPTDRLVPSERKLQALRVFANQATTALDTAAQYEEMQFLAEHDPLTRLLNRRAFNERLEQEVSRSVRYGHPMALVLCDLNGFKALNDRNGHAAGDEALEVVGGVLTGVLRTADAAFRIGGDEFALILPETGEDEATGGGRPRRRRRWRRRSPRATRSSRPASESRSARATATIRARSSAPQTARCTRRSRACPARRRWSR